jgi:hypothetical protein
MSALIWGVYKVMWLQQDILDQDFSDLIEKNIMCL